MPFVHLHCHTDYSLLDGACDIDQLMQLAVLAPALIATEAEIVRMVEGLRAVLGRLG